ncbi:MAG: hypothetical protein M1315_01030 [Candidatus Thermoplasmatota archaeon]|nr:hypothetical protein [Candidatus Thermoplasmatota archaeon]
MQKSFDQGSSVFIFVTKHCVISNIHDALGYMLIVLLNTIRSWFVYRIYNCRSSGNEVLNSLLADDIVGRLSIDHMDASLYGNDMTGLLILVEGSEDSLKRSDEIVNKRCEIVSNDIAEKLYQTINEQKRRAESGMGFFFE